jgi:hypothetical protein
VTSAAKLRRLEQRTHDGAAVSWDVSHDGGIRDLTINGRTILTRKQCGAANCVTTSAIKSRFSYRVADGTRDAFVVHGPQLFTSLL